MCRSLTRQAEPLREVGRGGSVCAIVAPHGSALCAASGFSGPAMLRGPQVLNTGVVLLRLEGAQEPLPGGTVLC